MAQAMWVYNMEFENHLVVTLDRRKIYETSVGGEEDMKAIDQRQDPAVDAINKRLKNIHFNATAGPHQVVSPSYSGVSLKREGRLQPHVPGGGEDRVLRVTSFEVRGPLNATGLSETPSRQRIYVCYPKNAAGGRPLRSTGSAAGGRARFRRPIDDRRHAGSDAVLRGRVSGSAASRRAFATG